MVLKFWVEFEPQQILTPADALVFVDVYKKVIDGIIFEVYFYLLFFDDLFYMLVESTAT